MMNLTDGDLMQMTTAIKRERKVPKQNKETKKNDFVADLNQNQNESSNNEMNWEQLKPTESFSQLIINALSEAEDFSLQLRDIYNYIIEK